MMVHRNNPNNLQWMKDKNKLWYIHSGILLSYIKEYIIDVCNDLDESQGNYIERQYILRDNIFETVLEMTK